MELTVDELNHRPPSSGWTSNEPALEQRRDVRRERVGVALHRLIARALAELLDEVPPHALQGQLSTCI